MPRTIEEGFSDFLLNLAPTAGESAAVKAHRASIRDCLERNFGLIRFAPIGSFGNGTSIRCYSDVDYIACIPRAQLTQTSNASLVKIKNALAARFPSTGVIVRSPTVTVPFGIYRAETTEIVPADYMYEQNGFKVYDIPDSANGWMKASPDAHNRYVRDIDAKHNGRVKPLIRLIKAWKYFREVPISSFYLEMKVAKYASGESAILYDIDVKRFLNQLLREGLSSMYDPMGFSGCISPCSSAANRDNALSKLATAASRAEKAYEATVGNNISKAFEYWDMLYNYEFPNYYK
jgi:hypothetical protein